MQRSSARGAATNRKDQKASSIHSSATLSLHIHHLLVHLRPIRLHIRSRMCRSPDLRAHIARRRWIRNLCSPGRWSKPVRFGEPSNNSSLEMEFCILFSVHRATWSWKKGCFACKDNSSWILFRRQIGTFYFGYLVSLVQRFSAQRGSEGIKKNIALPDPRRCLEA